MIPYGKQDIDQKDIDAVIGVLKSDFLTQGPKVPLFEKQVSEYCSVKYGVALNSATSALHVACIALNLKKGDWLWTSPNSFVASANCGLYCGALVDFVDIDKDTYNISTDLLEEKLIIAKKENKLPKIVVVVHYAGQSSDMQKIASLSKKYGFRIIEDASHAIGGRYKGKSIGSCMFSDITVFSFHPVKIITTAEGGMATTNSKELANRMTLLRSHGITRNHDLMSKESEGNWYYEQHNLGFNYRMTELNAALGISQMQRLDKFIVKRHKLKNRYNVLLNELPVIKPYQCPESYSSIHLYPIKINFEIVEKTRKEIFDELRENQIGVNVHYIPIHLQPYYKNFGFKPGDFPESEAFYANMISLPLFYSMSFKDQDLVVNKLKKILNQKKDKYVI